MDPRDTLDLTGLPDEAKQALREQVEHLRRQHCSNGEQPETPRWPLRGHRLGGVIGGVLTREMIYAEDDE